MKLTRTALPAALAAALLSACTGEKSETPTNDELPTVEETAEMLDTIPPTEEEAQAEAAATITEENADAEFERLKSEIESGEDG